MLLKGFILGFGIAAPVGPIGVLCIHKTLSEGMKNGILCGLGAAVVDTLYGAIAAFGLTSISGFLVSHQQFIRIVGGIFLCYIAFKTFFSPPVKNQVHTQEVSANNFVSTFFLTLTNPMTILAYATIFAGMGIIHTEINYFHATLLVCGVFLGSMSWWIILALLVNLLRLHLFKSLHVVNKLSGALIFSFAFFILIQGLNERL